MASKDNKDTDVVVGGSGRRTAAINKIKNINLPIFIGIFAVLGVIALIISFALTPSNGDYEAESMTLQPLGGVVNPPTTDTTAPSSPTNLAATAISSSQINLTWTASTDNVGVTGYKVYRNQTQIATVTATSYGDANGLSASTAYTYTVRAYDAAGNTSADSNLTSATTMSNTTPPPPPPPPSGGTLSSTTPCLGTAYTAPATYKHVIWIWMENHRYADVINNSGAPYQTSLATKLCASSKAYASVGAPSLPNYIGATSGSTQGITDDNPPSSHVLTVDNIFRQVRTIGGTAKSFEETMPSNCSLSSSGNYAVKHNPAAYYTGGTDRTACNSDDVPMGTTTSGAFLNALASDTSLPTFSFVTPNMCNDTHDCSVATGDGWLKSWMPKILDSPAYKSGDTAVVLMYDEYTSMPNAIIAPSVKPGYASSTSYNHYSLLRTTEEMLGIKTYLGGAANAKSMRTDFNW